MLLALQDAIDALLKSALPSLFAGDAPVQLTFSPDSWDFDRLSADPIAGEPGPEDAIDELCFDPSAPGGPYSLTRPPYPGPKRVYLRSGTGELVTLRHGEVVWSAVDPASFALVPAAGRVLSGCDHLHVMYSVVAETTRMKSLHRLALRIAGHDAGSAEQAFALALAVLVMNREALLRAAAFSWAAGGYQVDGTLKTLKFTAGSTPAASERQLALEAELELRLERLYGNDDQLASAQLGGAAALAGAKVAPTDMGAGR